jgi:ribosomal protein L32E|tara:strand:+ start:2119 stop:2445 length:327 start_codon:yes stop_codon:yes gene_type:complete
MKWQMNINKYISEHSIIKEKNNIFEITMCVSPKKQIDIIGTECEEGVHVKINNKTIKNYLHTKGYENIEFLNNSSIDNKHPHGLTATWFVRATNTKSKKSKRKSSSEK